MAALFDHDAYIASAPESLRPLLAHLRDQLARTLTDAEPVMKYDMPGFALNGHVVAGYAAFSKQCGLYVSKEAISICSDDIASAGLKASKTGVTFSASRPIPDKLVVALARASESSLTCE